jgi:hypothetical protein
MSQYVNKPMKERFWLTMVGVAIGFGIALVGVVRNSAGLIGAGILVLVLAYLPMWVWKRDEPEA